MRCRHLRLAANALAVVLNQHVRRDALDHLCICLGWLAMIESAWREAETAKNLLVLDHALGLAAGAQVAEFRALTLPGPEPAHGQSNSHVTVPIEDRRAALHV